METKEWQRSIKEQTFLISTARDMPHEFVQKAFDTPEMYWAKTTSDANMQKMLDNSCTLGLYKLESNNERTPIGLARMVTDYVTLAYLTDVYLSAEFRNLGLGRWLVHCCREIVLEIPDLRWMILLTGSEDARRMYSKELGMSDSHFSGKETLVAMGARKARLQEAAAASPAPPDA